MMLKTMASLGFAASCLTAIATMSAHAQMAGIHGSTPGYNGPESGAAPNQSNAASSASAHRNVIQSEHYDRTLETNRKFRQARMHKECGPITDPQLRQSCLASFNQDAPYMGSSSPQRSHRSGADR